jgi:hypothetical protein
MKQFIRDLWLIHVERAKVLRAQRMLSKQEWSIDFLVMLLNKAAAAKKAGVSITVKNKDNLIVISAAGLDKVDEYKKQAEDIDIRHREVTLGALLDDAWNEGILR